MQNLSSFVQKQKEILMLTKDKHCLPIVKGIGNKVTADLLTCSRILMAAVLFLLLFLKVPYLFVWTVILYLLAKFTDMLDGCLARLRSQVTLRGELLDALADKIFYLIGFLALIFLWPKIFAFKLIFMVMAVALVILITDYLRFLLKLEIKGKIKLWRRIFEGLGYLLAVILFIAQLIVK